MTCISAIYMIDVDLQKMTDYTWLSLCNCFDTTSIDMLCTCMYKTHCPYNYKTPLICVHNIHDISELTGDDRLFLEKSVYGCLACLFRLYTNPHMLEKMDFDQPLPGISSFYDL